MREIEPNKEEPSFSYKALVTQENLTLEMGGNQKLCSSQPHALGMLDLQPTLDMLILVSFKVNNLRRIAFYSRTISLIN